jgi:hypothetical protein
MKNSQRKSAASHCCAFFVFLRPKDVSKSKKLRVVWVYLLKIGGDEWK